MELDNKHTAIARNFLRLNTLYDLARFLKIEPYVLLHIAKNPEYRSFRIRKSNGGYRPIDAPNAIQKRIQKKLNRSLQHVYLGIKPEQVHGFIIRLNRDCPLINIRSNAQKHVGQKYLLNLDLKEFFHSITAGRVREIFMTNPFNYPKDISSLLALMTTWYNRLPMGAPTSPVISNLVCLDLDIKLIKIAEDNKLIYSRYADDISFSGNSYPDNLLLDQLKTLINSEGFQVNQKKVRIQPNSRRQVVTGITVNDKPNLPRKYYRNLRAIMYNWEHKGIESTVAQYYRHLPPPYILMKSKFLDSIRARIEYFEYVRGQNDPLTYKLKEHYYRNRFTCL